MGENHEQEEPRYSGRRVENRGANVLAWCASTGNGASTVDLCLTHADLLEANPHRYDGVILPSSDGEPVGGDGWGGDVDAPDYDKVDYRCALPNCGVLLGTW